MMLILLPKWEIMQAKITLDGDNSFGLLKKQEWEFSAGQNGIISGVPVWQAS